MLAYIQEPENIKKITLALSPVCSRILFHTNDELQIDDNMRDKFTTLVNAYNKNLNKITKDLIEDCG